MKPFLRALSGLFINLSAAWFILAFVTPNFADITMRASQIILLRDVFLGILFFVITVLVEKKSE